MRSALSNHSYNKGAPVDLHVLEQRGHLYEGSGFACPENEPPSSGKEAHVCLTISGWQSIENLRRRVSEPSHHQYWRGLGIEKAH